MLKIALTSTPERKKTWLAGVVQLVERLLAKEKVVSSSLIARFYRTDSERYQSSLGDVAKW